MEPRTRQSRTGGEHRRSSPGRFPRGESRSTSREPDRCPECGSAAVVSENDREVLCDDCGLVISERNIDRGPEWRSFGHEDRLERSRVGAPTTTLLHDRGLTTAIDWRDTDARGRPLSDGKRRQMDRLRTWQERIRIADAGERNLHQALIEIERMSSALELPHQCRADASVLYRRAMDADLIKGRSIEGVAAATLYISCRNAGLPRSLTEVAAVARVDRNRIGRCYRYLAAELDIDLAPLDPRQFVVRFCAELGCSPAVVRLAHHLLDRAADTGLFSGRSPTGVGGGAIYTAAVEYDEPVTQQDVARVADVTVVTIRNRFHELSALVDDPSTPEN